jgi:energy-coupling factor transporter ATP-binding protein EcfA2
MERWCIVIRLEQISFQYGAENLREGQLKDISLHVKPGEFILLTGKSGCGKTTLTRVINGLCPQFYPGILTGNYFLNGRNAADIPISELGSLIGSVFQDPRSQFFATNTTDEIVLGMENAGLPRERMIDMFRKTVSQVGVDNLLERPLFPLSSGEKQRIAIAAACAVQPKILVLDEPSANLDSDAILRLSTLLFRLKEAGTTIILSEHRLHYVKDLFDRMIVMEKGRITAEYERGKALCLTEDTLKSMGLRLFQEPTIVPGNRMVPIESAALSANQISVSFDGHKILDEAELCAQNGKILVIMGSNGAGKSSLCRVITGLYKQQVGQVSINGKTAKRKRRTLSTFFVQQDTDYQLYAATVEDEFRVGKRRKDITQAQIESFLNDVGLYDVLERHPLSLSGGQKQRLLLALSAASGKSILVLDEPTSGLDGENMRITAGLLKKIAAQGKSVILITHDLELLNEAADSLVYMDNGKVLYHKALLKKQATE